MSSMKNLRMVKSEEAISDKMSIFTVPPTDIASEGRRIMTISNKNPPTDNVVLFTFEVSGGYMIVMDEIEFEVKGKVVNGDGSTLDAMATGSWSSADATLKTKMQKSDVMPVNQLLFSLFKHARIRIQDQYIDLNDFHVRALLNTICNTKYGNVERFIAQMYSEQVGKNADKYSIIRQHPSYNILGSVAGKLIKESREFQMRGKIPLDVTSINKYMLSRVPITIELLFNSPATYLRSSKTDASFKFEMTDCKLFVPTVKVRPDVEVANGEILKKQPALYPFERTVLRTFAVPSGNITCETEDLSQGKVPMQTLIFMVSSTNCSPGYKNNPFHFQHFKLGEINYKVDDNVQSMKMKFGTDSGDSQATQPYAAFVNMFPELEISLNEFITDTPFFAFDSRNSFDITGSLPMIKKGMTSLEMRFDAALENNITLFVYAKFPTVMQIDEARNVSI
jgi:hypothetical protein